MKEIDSKRMTLIITAAGSVAMLIFLYMVICFFRLDWIRYDEVERSWKVESMLCENQPPLSVIRLYKKTTLEPDFLIRFNRSMYQHLSEQQEKIVRVKRKLVGYLRELDYGIVLPLSIAGKKVADRSQITPQQQQNCQFKTDPEIIRSVTSKRRKMR